MPFSRMKPRMASLSSLAQTTNTSAIGEWVIHIFAPFSTQPPSSRCFGISGLTFGNHLMTTYRMPKGAAEQIRGSIVDSRTDIKLPGL